MESVIRRQNEFEVREAALLDEAGRILVDQGYDGLTMDRLAEATGYSKGLMYKHFKSKDDLVAALAVRSVRVRVKRFRMASTFQGSPRERVLAIEVGEEVSFRQNPHHIGSELIIKMAGLESRVAEDRRELLRNLERECFGCVVEIVEEAIAAGDLKLKSPLTSADVGLSVMAMKWGTFSTVQNYRPLLMHFGVVTPLNTFRFQLQALFDGLGWKPLSSEWDYQESYHRILRDLFAEDAINLGMV